MGYQSLISSENIDKLASFLTLQPIKRHWHNELEILYCISGSFDVRIQEEIYHVKKGQIVLFECFAQHEFFNVEDSTNVLRVSLGPIFIKKNFKIIATLSFSTPVIDEINNPDSFRELSPVFNTLIDALTKTCCEEKEWIILSELYSLLVVLTRHFSSRKESSNEKRKRANAYENISTALTYLYDNFNQEITLQNITEICNCEKSTFCRQFKKATQMTFRQYMNMYRVDVACMLLAESEESVSKIAEAVGIPEPKTFSRLFKKMMGVSPKEYRRQAQKNNIDTGI